jgi:hypothetical protein
MDHRLALAGLLLASGCDFFSDGDYDGVPVEPWHGDTVAYHCPVSSVSYAYVCAGGIAGLCDGWAHIYPHGCVSVSQPYPWEDDDDLAAFLADLVDRCELDCIEQVDDQAEAMGRDLFITDCGGAISEADYMKRNCTTDPMAAPQTQRFELTWAPLGGAPVTATGWARYALSEERTPTLRVSALTVDQFEITTRGADVTALLGYPSGTRIVVTALRLDPFDVPLSSGTGRLPVGAAFTTAAVEVTEPGQTTVRTEIRGTNPWPLSLTHARGALSLAPVADGFGGTFTAR